MPSQGWVQTLVTAQSSGAAITAAAATSAIPAHAKFPLPGGFLANLGQQLWIRAMGKVSSVITTPGTMRFDVRFGGTVVFDGLAVLLDTAAAHVDKPFWLDIWLSLTTAGAAATLMGHGMLTSEVVKGSGTMPLGSMVGMLPWNSTPANGTAFDATASQQVDLQFTQTVATGSMTLQQYSLISMN